MSNTLLIIEDEALMGAELKRHFEREGWRVILADTLQSARQLLIEKELSPLAVLSDMNLPDGNALDLLDEVRQRKTIGEWIFLTGYGSITDSVRALRLGAYEFLEKPVDFDRLDLVIAGAVRSARAQRRLRDQFSAQSQRYTPQGFVGHSAATQRTREILAKLAAAPFSALVITGETGTGKGVAARILHHSGPRHDAPLVEVNCSALPKDLLESELFGHEAGAFTGAKGRRRGLFEQADGGTLFLDEIGEMPIDLQAKLLKALEEQHFRRIGGYHEINVDVDIIAATNHDLVNSIANGSFRSDLYHRLCVFELQLPPLRERRGDLDELVPLFVAEFNAKAGKNVTDISDTVWETLKAHNWPGNVRELRNVIERCVLFAEDSTLPSQWLQLQPAGTAATPVDDYDGRDGTRAVARDDGKWLQLPLDGSMGLEEMDRLIILSALKQNQYNVAATARVLNSTRDTLRYRISKYDIELPDIA